MIVHCRDLTENYVSYKGARIMQTPEEESAARLFITSDPEILSGEPVFRGTRVPVAALLDNLAAGLTLDEFLDNFPTVTREQAIQVLEFSKETITRLSKAA
jgi:uncharacterized protein (DUF433 family)